MVKSLTPKLKQILQSASCSFERQGKGDHEIWYSPITQRRFAADLLLTMPLSLATLPMLFSNKPD